MIVTFVYLHYLVIRISSIEALKVIDPLESAWLMTVGPCLFLSLVMLMLYTAE